MRIVCLSDTHNRQGRFPVPDGDLVVHAGDFSSMGRRNEVERFVDWFSGLPHRHKVFIAGNHDWLFEREPETARSLVGSVTYLEDSEVVIEGLRIWGSPWQPEFFNWAFNLPRGPALRAKWQRIPTGVDLLLTHGPPLGILDVVPRGDAVGCEELRAELARIRPRLHVFGHIHHSYGQLEVDGTRYVNAAICNEAYLPVNPAVVVDL